MKNKNFSYYIHTFLTSYLSSRRNLSKNSIISYRDTIKMFINYNTTIKKIKIENIDFTILNKDNVIEFLDYLENEKNNSVNSRNQRLSCIKSLCKYILTDNIDYLEQLQKIIKIESKKFKTKDINIFTEEEIKNILSKPNTSNKQELKDLVILVLLYDAALRVSELMNLNYDDVVLTKPYKIVVKISKGNKSREIPITSNTAKILNEYIKIYNIKSNDIFIKSNFDKRYSPNGIRYIINKYTKNFRFKVHPHIFRHTKASHMVNAGIPIIYIRDFLGHEHLETTEIYMKVNNNIKDETIINNSIDLQIPIKYDINNSAQELLDFLNKI